MKISRLGVVSVLMLGAILVALEVSYPDFFFNDDNAKYFLPHYVHNYRTLVETGELAVVNFYQYMGMDQVAVGQTGVLFVPAYVAVGLAQAFGKLELAMWLLVSGHLLVGLVGMAVWMRMLRVEKELAWLGGLVWTTSVMLLAGSRSWVFLSYFVGLAPWILATVTQVLGGGLLKWWWGYVLAKSLLFFSGYVQLSLWMALLEWGWIVVGGFRKSWKGVVAYVGLQMVWLVTILPLLVPMWLQLANSADRSEKIFFEHFIYNAISWKEWGLAQVGRFESGVFMTSMAMFLVSGSLAVVGLAGVKLREKMGIKWWAWVGFGGLWLAMSTEMAKMLYWVPILNRFRWPFKHYVGFLLVLTVAMVLALNELWRRRVVAKEWLTAGLVMVILVQVLVVAQQDKALVFDSFSYDPEKLASFELDRRYRSVSVGAEDFGKSATTLSYNVASLVRVPVLGGYDPYVSQVSLEAALGLNYINSLFGSIDSEMEQKLRDRGVGYLLVQPGSKSETQVDELGWDTVGRADGVRVVELPEAEGVVSVDGQAVQVSYLGNRMEFVAEKTGEYTVRLNPEVQWEVKVAEDKILPETDGFLMRLGTIIEGTTVVVRGRNRVFGGLVVVVGLGWLGAIGYESWKWWRGGRGSKIRRLPS